MKTIIIITLMALASISFGAQEKPLMTSERPVVRIKIRKADPALIMMLLKGMNPTQPEYSTIIRNP